MTGSEEMKELREEIARRSANESRLEAALSAVASAVGGTGEAKAEELAERVKGAMERARGDRALAEETLVGGRFRELVAERGVVDADAAGRLIDMSGVKADVEGRKVEGLEEAMDALLSERPYLVGRPIAGGTPGGGTPRGKRGGRDEETLAGRVKKEFARRLPSGMSVPGGESGPAGSRGMRIR